MKKCNVCGKTKPLEDFSIKKIVHEGPNIYEIKCKECKKAYDYKRWNISREKIKDQNCCQICNRKINLVVDHNHATGYIRGLLCSDCNFLLGSYEDKVVNIENWIKKCINKIQYFEEKIEGLKYSIEFSAEATKYLKENNDTQRYGKYENPRHRLSS